MSMRVTHENDDAYAIDDDHDSHDDDVFLAGWGSFEARNSKVFCIGFWPKVWQKIEKWGLMWASVNIFGISVACDNIPASGRGKEVACELKAHTALCMGFWTLATWSEAMESKKSADIGGAVAEKRFKNIQKPSKYHGNVPGIEPKSMKHRGCFARSHFGSRAYFWRLVVLVSAI